MSPCVPTGQSLQQDCKLFCRLKKRAAGSTALRASGVSCIPWILCAIIFCSCFSTCLTDSDNTTDSPSDFPTPPPTPTLPPTPPVFDKRECVSSFKSISHKRYICVSNPELFPILKYAEQLAKKNCEELFKNEHWNCSGFSLLNAPNITTRDYMYPEEAYVHALSLAVITHTVAEGCGGIIKNWCPAGDSVLYGLHIAETFLNLAYASRGTGPKQQLIQHNYGAAKLIIHEMESEKACKCHGISGSCTMTICLSQLPDFDEIAKKIKLTYSDSCLVSANGHSRNSWVADCFSEASLIHTKEDKWCQFNPAVGSVGVSGRECNPLPNVPDSCDRICTHCGVGSQEEVLVIKKQCGCKFRFCCEIDCETCEETRPYSSCS